MPIVLNSGSPKFLELLGPVQACNGIALSLQINSKSKFRQIHTIFCSLQEEKFLWEAAHVLSHWLLGPASTA
jgi:hypothetical protein